MESSIDLAVTSPHLDLLVIMHFKHHTKSNKLISGNVCSAPHPSGKFQIFVYDNFLYPSLSRILEQLKPKVLKVRICSLDV